MSLPTGRRRFLYRLLAGASAAMAGCGTILYPERRGQPRGQLDWGVVMLDGIGLLLFLVPGVIAFAVDFATGAIYLPSGGYGRNEQRNRPFEKVDVPKHELTRERIEQVISARTTQPVALELGEYRTRQLDNLDDFWTTHDALSPS